MFHITKVLRKLMDRKGMRNCIRLFHRWPVVSVANNLCTSARKTILLIIDVYIKCTAEITTETTIKTIRIIELLSPFYSNEDLRGKFNSTICFNLFYMYFSAPK